MGTTESTSGPRPFPELPEDDDWIRVVIDPGSGVIKYGLANDATLRRLREQAEAAMAAATGSAPRESVPAASGGSGGGSGGAGGAGDDTPEEPIFKTLPAVIGRMMKIGETLPEGPLPWGTWLSSFFAAEPTEEVIVGQDALDYVDRDEGKRMRIFYPTEEAQVKENGGWEAMKILLDKILHDLGVADKLDKCLVFLTEPPYSSNQNRVNFMRMILDRKTGFGCGGFFMGTQAILAKTGFDIAHPKKERVRTVTVLDVGDGLSHVIPVVDNVPQLAQAADTKLAGRHVTTAFETILRRELGVSVETSREHEAARLLKQAVAVAPQDDAHKERIEAIRVPDGPPALVKYLPRPVGADLPFGNVAGAPLRFVSPRARWLCGDILFNPASAEHILYMHRETKSVVHIVDKAISDSPVDARNDLRTILLSGGTTLMEGFAERLAVDVNRLQSARFPRAEPCRVLRDPLRHILVYRGAVYVCKQIKFQAPNALDPKLRVRTWMTQSEYEDRKDAGDKRLAAFFETKTGVRATNLSGVARAT